MVDFNDCPGGPRAPITHEMWDNLVAENKRLSGMIRDKYTLPPNDFGDDISTELAIQYAALEQRIQELETEAANYSNHAAKRIAELEAENGNMDSMYQDRMLDLEAKLHKHYEAERDNLKADAQKILESRAKVSLEIIDLRAENEQLREAIKLAEFKMALG